MLQAFAALAGAGLTLAACYALGALLLRRIKLEGYESIALGFLLGAACLHLAVFAILALKLAYWPVLLLLVILPLPFAWRAGIRPRGLLAPCLIFLPFSLLYFFRAWSPEMSPDGSGYHLGIVARYLRAHSFEPITTSILASLSEGAEMLFVPAFAIGRHSAAALVHLGFLAALALAIYAFGRRIGKPWVGLAAAALVYFSPVAGIDASSAYNDVAAAAVVFGAFYFLELWDAARDSRLLVPIGLLCGYAFAIKYTAVAILPLALVWILWRSRKLKPSALVAVCALAMAAPWMIKNWSYVENPVAPLANQVFRNPYAHVQFERELGAQMRSYTVENRWTLPLEVTIRGEKTQGLLGPAFLLAPVALLALGSALGRRLLVAAAVFLAVYFTNIGTRFLIPVLPFLALAIALALERISPWSLAALILFHAVSSWPAIVDRYAAPYAWRIPADRPVIDLRAALRKIPQDRFLRENYPPYAQARLIEDHVPPGERVLAFNGIPDSYTTRDVLVTFRSAFGELLDDILQNGWQYNSQPHLLQTFRFPRVQTRRMRIAQTSTSPDQWSVHELRFFRQGTEVPRKPIWRLKAWPNPWDVQLAFDSSPVTRWRSWEPSTSGMYFEIDFGGYEQVDEVRIETSRDSPAQPEVQIYDDSGPWVTVASNPSVDMVSPAANLRYAATREVALRAVRYLLVNDNDFGAADFRDNSESWGLSEVSQGYGVRLYRVVP